MQFVSVHQFCITFDGCFVSSLCPSLMIFQFLLIMKKTGARNSRHLRRVCTPVLSVRTQGPSPPLTQARSTAPSLQSAIYVKLSLWACCVVSGCTLSLAPPGTRARPGPRTDSDWHRPIFESTGKIGVVDRYYVFTRSLIPRLLQVVIPNHCAALAGKKQNTDGHCSNSSPHYKYKYYRAYLFEMWRQGVVGARVKRNTLNVVNRANLVS